MKIYNCHTHLFTLDHVPERFLPKFVMWALKQKWTRKMFRRLLPGKRDLLERYVNFFEVNMLDGQANVLKRLKGYYPQGSVDQTEFIVLPMDMEHMLAGKVKAGIDEQHEELLELLNNGEPVIPFIGTDPRKKTDVLAFVKKWHEKGFKGVKLYPPLGYYPTHSALMDEVYPYCIQHKLPIMAHCSRGGVHVKKVTDEMLDEPNPINRPVVKSKAKEFSDIYTDPSNYVPVLEKHKDLRICLAHFGGGDEWDKYLLTSWDTSMPDTEKSWLSVIKDLMLKYDHVYADISSTLFQGGETRIHLLKVLLQNEKIRKRVLFGSDYYMMERVKDLERINAIKLRSELGETLFKQIAVENAENYLN